MAKKLNIEELNIIIAQVQSLKKEALSTEKAYLKKLLELLNLGFINCNAQFEQKNYTRWDQLVCPTWDDEQEASVSWLNSNDNKKEKFFNRCQKIAQPLISKPPAPKSWWQKVADFISPNRVLAEKHIAEKSQDFGLLQFFTTQLGFASCQKIQARGERLWQDVHLLSDMMTKIDDQIEFYQKQIKLYRWSLFGAVAWKKYTQQKNKCDVLKKKMKDNLRKYIVQLKTASLDEIPLPQQQDNLTKMTAHIETLEKKCCAMGIKEDFSVLKKHLMKLYLNDFLSSLSKPMVEERIFPSHLMGLAGSLGMADAMNVIQSAWALKYDEMPNSAKIEKAFATLFNPQERLFSKEVETSRDSIFSYIIRDIHTENHKCYKWLKKNKEEYQILKDRFEEINTKREDLLKKLRSYIITNDDQKSADPDTDANLIDDLRSFLEKKTVLKELIDFVSHYKQEPAEKDWYRFKKLAEEFTTDADRLDKILYSYIRKWCLYLLEQGNFKVALSSEPMGSFYDRIAQDNEVQKKLQSLFECMPHHVPDLLKFYPVVMKYGSSATKQIFYDKLSSNHAYATCANFFLSQNGQADIPDVFLRDQAFQHALRDFIVENPLLINIKMLISLRSKPALTDVIDEALNLLFDKSLKDFVHPENNQQLARQLDHIAEAYSALENRANDHRALCWHNLKSVRFNCGKTKEELQSQLDSLMPLLPGEPRVHALTYFLMLCQFDLVRLRSQEEKERLRRVFQDFLRSNATNFKPCSCQANRFLEECGTQLLDFSILKEAGCLPREARFYTPPSSPHKVIPAGFKSRLPGSKQLPESSSHESLASISSETSVNSIDDLIYSLSDSFDSFIDSESKSDTEFSDFVDVSQRHRPARICNPGLASKMMAAANQVFDNFKSQNSTGISLLEQTLISCRDENQEEQEMIFWDVIAERIVSSIYNQDYGLKTFEDWWLEVSNYFSYGLSSSSTATGHFLLNIIMNYGQHKERLSTLEDFLQGAKDNLGQYMPQDFESDIKYLRCLLVAGLAENTPLFRGVVNDLQHLSCIIGESLSRVSDWRHLGEKINEVVRMSEDTHDMTVY